MTVQSVADAMLRRQWVVLATAAFAVILVLIVAAPYMAPHGTFTHLDGDAGYIDNGWLGHRPAGIMYLLGDLFCHQDMDRSYILNGSQLPVCIRDTGILAGLVVGFLACVILDRRLGDRRFAYVGVVLVVIMAAEWTTEGFVGDMPVPRFVSGICAGIGAALFLSWMLYRDAETDYNQ